MVVSEKKKQYMKRYNKQPEVRSRKADYMRKKRAEKEVEASRNLVNLFLDFGYENLAEEMAIERAPEMLVTVDAKHSRKVKK